MMQAVDYKSRELNLFFADNSKKFRVTPVLNDPEVGSCFELKTTDNKNAGNDGIYIEYLMTNTNYGKLGVGYTLGELKGRATTLESGLATEITDRKSGDSKLQANIDSEAATRFAQVSSLSSQIAVEVSARTTDTFNLNAAITSEASARSAADSVHTGAIAQANLDIVAESKAARAAETKIASDLSTESKSRSDEDVKINGLLSTESKARADADTKISGDLASLSAAVDVDVKRIDGRIDFITSNTNPSALDSLSEIVSNFNANGAGYASRLTYLEGVIQELLNKSQ